MEHRIAALAGIAATLGRRARRAKGLAGPNPPSLWFLTDPIRTPDPLSAAARLPRGAAVIYRGFGAPDAALMARRLRRLTWSRGLVLLIGADAALAAAVGADGVHLPERLMRRAPGLRRRHPRWLITGAAHGPAAISAGGRLGLDALLVSAVFESKSPSAGRPLGVVRFSALATASRAPVMALGGISATTARRLRGSPAAGLAAVEALAVASD